MKHFLTLFLLIATYCCNAQQIIFKGDFNNGIIAGRQHPLCWQRYAPSAPTANDHRFKLDSVTVRQGKYSLRVEVRPGDTTNPRSDRVEVVGMYDSTTKPLFMNDKSPDQYFAFSVLFDKSWKAPLKTGIDTTYMEYHGNVIQLKKTGIDVDTTNPAFSMQATDRIFIKTATGDVYNPYRVVYELSNGKITKGKWIDFIIKFGFDINNHGYILLWRRDQDQIDSSFKRVLKVDHVNTLFYQLNGNVKVGIDHQWHAGYYRSKQLTDGTGITNILWLDGFTIATTSNAAQKNAFGYVTVLPKDNISSGSFVTVPVTDTKHPQTILSLTQ